MIDALETNDSNCMIYGNDPSMKEGMDQFVDINTSRLLKIFVEFVKDSKSKNPTYTYERLQSELSEQKMEETKGEVLYKELLELLKSMTEMSDTNEREYLELVERGYPIKLINIDYMDLMRPRSRFSGDGGDLRAQKEIVRDLKTLAKRYNIGIWTAAQVSRGGGVDAEDPNFIFTNKNIAEAYDKVRASDILITVNVTTKEMHDNRARLFVDTVRDNPSRILIPIKRDLDHSRFYV
jgi:hypothetical protein